MKHKYFVAVLNQIFQVYFTSIYFSDNFFYFYSIYLYIDICFTSYINDTISVQIIHLLYYSL